MKRMQLKVIKLNISRSNSTLLHLFGLLVILTEVECRNSRRIGISPEPMDFRFSCTLSRTFSGFWSSRSSPPTSIPHRLRSGPFSSQTPARLHFHSASPCWRPGQGFRETCPGLVLSQDISEYTLDPHPGFGSTSLAGGRAQSPRRFLLQAPEIHATSCSGTWSKHLHRSEKHAL